MFVASLLGKHDGQDDKHSGKGLGDELVDFDSDLT